jgi:hypothetical protein
MICPVELADEMTAFSLRRIDLSFWKEKALRVYAKAAMEKAITRKEVIFRAYAKRLSGGWWQRF